MKKILAVLMILGLGAGVANLAWAAPVTIDVPVPERGTLSLNLSTIKEISPDVADVTIVITTKSKKSVQDASAENKEISDKVYAALKAMIDVTKDDYIKTANFTASPDYVYNSTGKPTIKGYTVNNNIIVHTKKLEKVGEMVDKSINLGATSIGNINFSLSNYTEICDNLLGMASKNAYNQATIAAKNSASLITGIKSFNISCTGNSSVVPRSVNFSAKMMSADMAEGVMAKEESFTVIESGALKINAYVNAVYFVK